jgi:hypothetical protein
MRRERLTGPGASGIIDLVGLSLKPQHLKRYKDVALLLIKCRQYRPRVEPGAARRQRHGVVRLRPRAERQATGHRLPAVYETRLFAEAGGLLSYGPLTHERFARVALYVDRILRGAQPGELPVEQPGT